MGSFDKIRVHIGTLRPKIVKTAAAAAVTAAALFPPVLRAAVLSRGALESRWLTLAQAATPLDVVAACAGEFAAPLGPLAMNLAARAFPAADAAVAALWLCAALFALTLALVYLSARRLTGDRAAAGITAVFISVTTVPVYITPTPNALSAFFAAVFFAALAVAERRAVKTAAYIGIFISALGGFLTQYQFPALCLCAAGLYGLWHVIRRRPSSAAGPISAVLAALLAGIILHPACLNYYLAPSDAVLPWAQRFLTLFKIFARRLSGGTALFFITPAALAAAWVYSALAPPSRREGTPAGDPAAQAYLRRVSRRAPKRRAPRLSPRAHYCAALCAGIALYAALISNSLANPGEAALAPVYCAAAMLSSAALFYAAGSFTRRRGARLLAAALVLALFALLSAARA